MAQLELSADFLARGWALTYAFLIFAVLTCVIDLRGGQTLMPQHLLYTPNIGTSIEQMCRKTMSQRMRRCPSVQPTREYMLFKHPTNTSRREPLPKLVGKRWLLFLPFFFSPDSMWKIGPQCPHGIPPNDPNRSFRPLPRIRTTPRQNQYLDRSCRPLR